MTLGRSSWAWIKPTRASVARTAERMRIDPLRLGSPRVRYSEPWGSCLAIPGVREYPPPGLPALLVEIRSRQTDVEFEIDVVERFQQFAARGAVRNGPIVVLQANRELRFLFQIDDGAMA